MRRSRRSTSSLCGESSQRPVAGGSSGSSELVTAVCPLVVALSLKLSVHRSFTFFHAPDQMMILEQEVQLVDVRFEHLKVRHQLARCTTRSPVARDPGRYPRSEAGRQRTRTITSYLRRTPTRAGVKAGRRCEAWVEPEALAAVGVLPLDPVFGEAAGWQILPTRRRRRRGIARIGPPHHSDDQIFDARPLPSGASMTSLSDS
jgi:hypothetical protein